MLTFATQPGGWWPIGQKKKKKKKKICKTSYVKKWEVFYCMPMEVKEDAQEQSVMVAGLPGWRFLWQLSQIWHILKWVAVKKITGHFSLKCQQEILLPTEFKICRIWESWHKKANLATLDGSLKQKWNSLEDYLKIDYGILGYPPTPLRVLLWYLRLRPHDRTLFGVTSEAEKRRAK